MHSAIPQVVTAACVKGMLKIGGDLSCEHDPKEAASQGGLPEENFRYGTVKFRIEKLMDGRS